MTDSLREWVDEAAGLGRMLVSISEQYRQAVEGLGGDSEFLRQSIPSAERYVREVLWPKCDAFRESSGE